MIERKKKTMKKYILVSKDNLKNTFTLFESDDFKLVFHKYELWKNILPKSSFHIYTRFEDTIL